MKNVTNIDAVDREKYADNIDRLPQSIPDRGNSFSDLLADSFASLYKYQPAVKAEVDPDRLLNKSIVEQMMDLSEFKQLRNFTVGDAANSAGALDIVNKVWETLPDAVKNAQQHADTTARAIDTALNSDEYDPNILQSLFRQAEEAKERLVCELEEYEDEVRQSVRAALVQAERDAADGEQAIAVLGWGQTGALTQSNPSYNEKLRIMQALKHSRKLQDIVRMAGRMTNIAQKKQRQKSQYLRTEVIGIEQGDDLSRVIPSEYGYFIHKNKALRNLFLKRFTQAELLQYEMESHEPKARGPIIVGVDCSGSMSLEDKDDWSKACALAMYSIARRQRRDFSVLLFTSQVMKEIFIKKGEHQPQQLIELLTYGTGGGTSFEASLNRCIELIERDEHSKADIVMITDGMSDVSEQFRSIYTETKKRKEFSTYTVIIGGSEYQKQIAEKFSDSVTTLDNMVQQNEGQAFNIVFNI